MTGAEPAVGEEVASRFRDRRVVCAERRTSAPRLELTNDAELTPGWNAASRKAQATLKRGGPKRQSSARRGYPELSCQGELRCDLSLVTGLLTRSALSRDIPQLCLCAGLKPGNRLKRVSASCLDEHGK